MILRRGPRRVAPRSRRRVGARACPRCQRQKEFGKITKYYRITYAMSRAAASGRRQAAGACGSVQQVHRRLVRLRQGASRASRSMCGAYQECIGRVASGSSPPRGLPPAPAPDFLSAFRYAPFECEPAIARRTEQPLLPFGVRFTVGLQCPHLQQQTVCLSGQSVGLVETGQSAAF